MHIRPLGAYPDAPRRAVALSKRRDHAIIKAIVAIIGLVPGAVADIVIGAPNDLVRASRRDSGNERAHHKADGPAAPMAAPAMAARRRLFSVKSGGLTRRRLAELVAIVGELVGA